MLRLEFVGISRSAAVITAVILVVAIFPRVLRPQLRFIWHCFIRPLDATNQKDRLDKFYQGQADIYDTTRNGLLRGRNTMLSLSASHLRSLRASSPQKRLVWVDIGGGTGHNIELMDKHIPIKSFDAVYLIDLCEPLLQVARNRFAAKGWSNVIVLCQDACQFTLPEWTKNGKDPKGSVGFVTLSYSLSMIPNYYSLLDRIEHVLAPDDGLLGVVDFYTAGKQPSLHEKAIGGNHKESHTTSGLAVPAPVMLAKPATHSRVGDSITSLEIGEPAIAVVEENKCGSVVIDVAPPLSTFHYQVSKIWRLPYYEQPFHKEFRTYIYSFTWEDPFEDMKHLDLSKNDSMFIITSGGDNALHYAIEAHPHRIHCVDMNPCQGHLAELKLAALQTLSHDEFFSLFGSGRHPHFRKLLDSKLAPHLSSGAYQFWRLNDDAFSSAFYMRGYSGWALRVVRLIFSIAGVTKYVRQLCECDTIEAQVKIWQAQLRPVLLNPVVVALLRNPIFCWNALGVPLNQRRMLLEEGSIYDFICHTLDPLISTYLLKTDNYFYLLALLGHYNPACCPNYLTLRGFNALKSNKDGCLDAIRLHTDSIVNVLRGLPPNSLTRALIMDHLDWFNPGSQDAVEEVAEFHRVLVTGGMIFWRSASRRPWYNEIFGKAGFVVTPVAIRDGSCAIDRVNM
ncbi:hypothetical protein C0993_007711 [Termitomyces sp. T159_Od127]|nr:hypothetical protein C0993_007711 [Termitomyces sp. T159_Od127]